MFGLPATAVVNQLQNILLFVGGIGVARGLFSTDQLGAIVGGITTIIAIVANAQTHQQALDTTPAPKPAPVASVAKPAPVSAGLPG